MQSEKMKHKMDDRMFPFRRLIIIGTHLGAIACSNYLAFLIRFEGGMPVPMFELFLTTLPWIVLIRFLFISFFGLNRGLWRYAGIGDMFGILKAVLGSSLVLYLLFVFGMKIQGYPRSIYIIDSLV